MIRWWCSPCIQRWTWSPTWCCWCCNSNGSSEFMFSHGMDEQRDFAYKSIELDIPYMRIICTCVLYCISKTFLLAIFPLLMHWILFRENMFSIHFNGDVCSPFASGGFTHKLPIYVFHSPHYILTRYSHYRTYHICEQTEQANHTRPNPSLWAWAWVALGMQLVHFAQRPLHLKQHHSQHPAQSQHIHSTSSGLSLKVICVYLCVFLMCSWNWHKRPAADMFVRCPCFWWYVFFKFFFVDCI